MSLAIGIALALANPFNLGTVSVKSQQSRRAIVGDVILAQSDTFGPQTVPMAYEITDELANLGIISAFAGAGANTDLLGSQGLIRQGFIDAYSDVYVGGSGGILNSDVDLFSAEDRIVATDVARPALRDHLVFSHENTARASVMGAHPLFDNIQNDPNDETWIRIYNAIDQHPRFNDLVNLIQSTGFLPVRDSDSGTEDYIDWTLEIAFDLIDQFLYPDGRPKSLQQ